MNTHRCPTCGRYLGVDPDGFYDTEPGGTDGRDYVVCYCDEKCAARKDPPSKPEPTTSRATVDSAS